MTSAIWISSCLLSWKEVGFEKVIKLIDDMKAKQQDDNDWKDHREAQSAQADDKKKASRQPPLRTPGR